MIYRFEELTSTNDEAADRRYVDGDVIWAERQSAGRGQRGHVWHSAEGENLTFSVVSRPRHLAPERQFLLSEAAALGVTDTLADYGIGARIKWTNDIYVGDRKITGMLIENKLCNGRIDRSVAGIGLNVNQTTFEASLPNPVSMASVTGRRFDRREVLERLLAHLAERYAALRDGDSESVRGDYHSLLYRLGEEHWYALPDGSRRRGTIRGVEPSGALRVEHADGSERSYLFKEIEFVIEGRERPAPEKIGAKCCR